MGCNCTKTLNLLWPLKHRALEVQSPRENHPFHAFSLHKDLRSREINDLSKATQQWGYQSFMLHWCYIWIKESHASIYCKLQFSNWNYTSEMLAGMRQAYRSWPKGLHAENMLSRVRETWVQIPTLPPNSYDLASHSTFPNLTLLFSKMGPTLPTLQNEMKYPRKST